MFVLFPSQIRSTSTRAANWHYIATSGVAEEAICFPK